MISSIDLGAEVDLDGDEGFDEQSCRIFAANSDSRGDSRTQHQAIESTNGSISSKMSATE